MRFCILFLCMILGHLASTQNLKFSPSIGVSYRTDNFIFPTLEKSHQYYLEPPFIGGGFLGVNPGVVFSYNKVGFEYHPNFRYGTVTERWVKYNNRFYQKFEKDWLIDHEFGLFFKPQRIRYGIGYSVLNDNARYDYVRLGQEMVQDAEYGVISVYAAVPVKNWFEVEFKCYYSREGDPDDPKQETWMFGLRLFKEFNLTKEDKD